MNFIWIQKPNGKYTLTLSKNKASGCCPVLRCRNKSRTDRRMCHRCCFATTRRNNPIWAHWHDIKYRHTRRGIKGKDRPCCTYQEWLTFHSTKPSPTHVVDRINPLLGYTLDNIQWLDPLSNARKGSTFDKELYRQAKIAEHKNTEVEFEPDFGIPDYQDPNHPF